MLTVLQNFTKTMYLLLNNKYSNIYIIKPLKTITISLNTE